MYVSVPQRCVASTGLALLEWRRGADEAARQAHGVPDAGTQRSGIEIRRLVATDRIRSRPRGTAPALKSDAASALSPFLHAPHVKLQTAHLVVLAGGERMASLCQSRAENDCGCLSVLRCSGSPRWRSRTGDSYILFSCRAGLCHVYYSLFRNRAPSESYHACGVGAGAQPYRLSSRRSKDRRTFSTC